MSNRELSKCLEDLDENGFCIISQGVESSLCDLALSEICTFVRRNIPQMFGENGLQNFTRAVNLHAQIPALAQIWSASDVSLQVQDIFLKSESMLYTSLFFRKGSEQALHVDEPFFYTNPPAKYLGVWHALEDVDSDNGPLQVLVGSHKLSRPDRALCAKKFFENLEDVPSSHPPLWDHYMATAVATAKQQGLEKQNIWVKKGDIIIWHPFLIHGGSIQNDPERTRFSLVTHVKPSFVPVMHQDFFFNPKKTVLPLHFDESHFKIGAQRVGLVHQEIDFDHEQAFKLETK
jgi:ectoine hydroxylase-related dioxygenase (phytanoyl-CoA dioxygenase family)